MATNLPSWLFNSIFRTTLEISSKLYFKLVMSQKLRLSDHRRADFSAFKF